MECGGEEGEEELSEMILRTQIRTDMGGCGTVGKGRLGVGRSFVVHSVNTS